MDFKESKLAIVPQGLWTSCGNLSLIHYKRGDTKILVGYPHENMVGLLSATWHTCARGQLSLISFLVD